MFCMVSSFLLPHGTGRRDDGTTGNAGELGPRRFLFLHHPYECHFAPRFVAARRRPAARSTKHLLLSKAQMRRASRTYPSGNVQYMPLYIPDLK